MFELKCLTLLLSAFPPFKISFPLRRLSRVSILKLFFFSFFFLYVFILCMQAWLLSLLNVTRVRGSQLRLSQSCTRGFICELKEPPAGHVFRFLGWKTSFLLSDRMHQILPAGLCHLIRLIFTFALMASPWRHMFQPWPDSDNAIQSFCCTDESQLWLWLNLYWIDINVHWFVTLI